MAPSPTKPAPGLDWSGIAMAMAVALAASLAGLENAFAYDDGPMIHLNARLHSLANWREILTSPYWPPPWNQEHYRPLTSLSWAAQYALGHGDPMVFRLVSYLWYAAVSAGVFVLAARLLPRAVALGTALLFAAHPVHVEAVAPAVGQSELGVALLAIVMTVFYLDRRRKGAMGVRDWAVLGALYVAASLVKEHGMALPALLVAVEVFLLGGPVLSRVRALWGGYGLLAALAAVVITVRFAVLGGQFSANWTAEAFDGATASGRALTMLQVVPEWARLMLWPAHLRLDYSPQEMTASTGWGAAEILGLALVLGGLVGMWLARRRAPVVSFGLAWTAIALLPVSNLILPTGSLLAERLLFLPSVGILLAAGGGAAYFLETARSPAWRPRALAAVAGLLTVAGILRSAERHRVWRNEALLSVRSVQDAPRSFKTQRAYGDVLFELGQREMALEAYRQAIALAPPGHAWRVRNDLARRFRMSGETDRELEQLRASLAEKPDQNDARGFLVAGYLLLGRYPEAAREADSALAYGGRAEVFQSLRALADSAARAGAPAGSVRIRITTDPGPPLSRP